MSGEKNNPDIAKTRNKKKKKNNNNGVRIYK